jgi:hypothetical protein
VTLLVASLTDIIKSKKAAGPKKRNDRRRALAAVKRESDRALVDLIRRRLALPVEKRINFLRKRVGVRGSAL